MWGLLLLAKFLAYLVVLIFIFLVSKKYCGWFIALCVTSILATAPWWDYYKVIKHHELCELDGGYRVYKTVPEGVESYFHSYGATRKGLLWKLENYKYAFIEGLGIKDRHKFFRYSLNSSGELEEVEIPDPVSEYEWFTEYLTGSLPYDLTGTRSGIRNRKTGEVIAALTNYVLKEPWGWYFNLLGGKGCVTQNLRETKFFSEVIPSKGK